MSFIWSQDRILILRRMWSAKVTAGNIGKHLGTTRNSVVGKASRLGLERRDSPIKRLPPGEKPKRIRANRGQARGTRLSVIKSSTIPVVREHHAPVITRPGTSCKWLNGVRPHWTYCGKDCQQGFSWCPEHKAIVYQPKPVAAE